MTLEELEQEIANTQNQIAPLKQKLDKLIRERNTVKSKLFIKINNITLENVEMSSGEGKPWFSTIMDFAKWMRKNGITKRFCEWNGTIYFTAEILNGKMDRDAPARITELEGYKRG